MYVNWSSSFVKHLGYQLCLGDACDQFGPGLYVYRMLCLSRVCGLSMALCTQQPEDTSTSW